MTSVCQIVYLSLHFHLATTRGILALFHQPREAACFGAPEAARIEASSGTRDLSPGRLEFLRQSLDLLLVVNKSLMNQ